MSTQSHKSRRCRGAVRFGVVVVAVATLLMVSAAPSCAEDGTEKLKEVLGNAHEWLLGIASMVAGLMLSIAGLRYLIATDPGETEKAKAAARAVLIGLAIVFLASAIVAIVLGILGEG